jgi:hypothetical protein
MTSIRPSTALPVTCHFADCTITILNKAMVALNMAINTTHLSEVRRFGRHDDIGGKGTATGFNILG